MVQGRRRTGNRISMSHTHQGDGRTRRRSGPEEARGRPGRPWGVVPAIACVAVLTACGGSGTADTGAADRSGDTQTSPAAGPAASTGTPPSSAAPSAEDPDEGGGGPPASAPATPRPAAVGRCEATGLALTLKAHGQEMNSKYFDLRLTNTGTEPCDLVGHPGVSLLDAGGERVGEPATRSSDGAGGGPVRLRPGQAAHATVKTAGEGVTDGRCWPEAATLLVYPPGSKQTVTTRGLDGLRVCGDSFQVGPVGDRAP